MRFRKTLTLLMLVMGLVFAVPAWAQQKPLTQDQVQSLVRGGLADESGAKLIEQRGIDFAPAKDFLQSLKAAGASEAFLKELRAAKPPEPASAKKPLNQVQVFALLAGQVSSRRVAMLVNERGLDFEPQQDYLDEVRPAGGDDELIAALKSAKVTKPATVDPAAQARQAEVRQRVARGAEFVQSKRYTDAETECRAAIQLDPQNSDPHVVLGGALLGKGDLDGALAEEREALRLNPDNLAAHTILGGALGEKGDWDGEIAEEREALRLNPDDFVAHFQLGVALGEKGDGDGEIAEYREALRLNPNYAEAHINLGVALSEKGDWDGDITEQREALRLNPSNDDPHVNLGHALGKKGDWDGAIAELREALRLNPDNERAHVLLGLAIVAGKGTWDGTIAEFREALRLNPNDALAHSYLGRGLEHKGDLQGALEQYRAAYMLDPKDATYKQDYERLLQHVNQ
jgi:tetratricopeptide (TPR) repeat protein